MEVIRSCHRVSRQTYFKIIIKQAVIRVSGAGARSIVVSMSYERYVCVERQQHCSVIGSWHEGQTAKTLPITISLLGFQDFLKQFMSQLNRTYKILRLTVKVLEAVYFAGFMIFHVQIIPIHDNINFDLTFYP